MVKKRHDDKPSSALSVAYKRKLGTLYIEDSRTALRDPVLKKCRGRVQMVFTSPPFPLNRKKKYGNLEGDAYVEWLASYANLLTEYLTPKDQLPSK
jgi:site-specific DNA-methyltransferase (cytosine-N4-specific)